MRTAALKPTLPAFTLSVRGRPYSGWMRLTSSLAWAKAAALDGAGVRAHGPKDCAAMNRPPLAKSLSTDRASDLDLVPCTSRTPRRESLHPSSVFQARTPRMPRKYTIGLEPRPGVPAGTQCESGCGRDMASGWSNGICAACRVKADRKEKKKKAAGAPLADVTNAKRARPEAKEQGASAMNYGIALAAAPSQVGGDPPHNDFDGQEAARVAAEELVAQAADEQSAIEQKLRAELSEVERQLASERAFAQRLLRTAVERTFEDEQESTVGALEEATGCSFVDLRPRLAALSVLLDIPRAPRTLEDCARDPHAIVTWC